MFGLVYTFGKEQEQEQENSGDGAAQIEDFYFWLFS